MIKARAIILGQIQKHRRIHDSALDFGEHKMALEHQEIADALEFLMAHTTAREECGDSGASM